MILQDIGAEVSQVSRRWLEGADQPSGAEVRTPDMDNMDYDQYQHSLTQYVSGGGSCRLAARVT